MDGPGYGAWWGVGMMFISLIVLALIVVGIVFVVRSPSQGAQPPQTPVASRALDLLDERFARGEIDQSEYEERRRILTSGR
jgi:putative membrane protein